MDFFLIFHMDFQHKDKAFLLRNIYGFYKFHMERLWIPYGFLAEICKLVHNHSIWTKFIFPYGFCINPYGYFVYSIWIFAYSIWIFLRNPYGIFYLSIWIFWIFHKNYYSYESCCAHLSVKLWHSFLKDVSRTYDHKDCKFYHLFSHWS